MVRSTLGAGLASLIAVTVLGAGVAHAADITKYIPACHADKCLTVASTRVHLPFTQKDYTAAKVYDSTTHTTIGIAVDSSGRVGDDRALQRAENKARFAVLGSLSRGAFSKVAGTAADSVVTLDVWGRADVPPCDKTVGTTASCAAAMNNSISASKASLSDAVSAVGARIVSQLPSAPSFTVVGTPGQLRALSRSSAVTRMSLPIEGGQFAGNTWLSATYADVAHFFGLFGTGSTVAINEPDQPGDYSHLPAVPPGGVYLPTGYVNQSYPHAEWVTGVVGNDLNLGMAPSTSILIANWAPTGISDPDPLTEIPWAMGKGASDVTYSFCAVNCGSRHGISDHDMVFDWYTKMSPFPLFTVAAGDFGNILLLWYVQNEPYNGLTVGATDDKGTASTADDTVADFSSWGNPTSPHGDRELPEISAPGVSVTSGTLTGTGTSASTPMVAGTAALIEQMNPTLKSWPEAKRAILMTTATTPISQDIPYPKEPGVDYHAGVGELNSFAAAAFADPGNKINPGNADVSQGYDYKTVTFWSDFPDGYYEGSGYRFVADAAGRVRAVLTWDSSAVCPNGVQACSSDTPDADLDLIAYDSSGNQVAWSESYDNTYEFIDLPVTQGEELYFRVHLWTNYASSTYMAFAVSRY